MESLSTETMMTDASSVPMTPMAVTVIGGYLGAGKTTLVNHILRTSDQRVAVLVNDFGDVNIDVELIESADGDTISLANGCICCSLVDGFAAALNTIKEIDPRPERLVIEASGVADPASVAAYGHSPGLALDAVVVLVDAETVRKRAADKYVGDTVLGQLRSANIIVLNKLDLIDDGQADAVRAWLKEKAPEAVVVDAERSEVPPSILFGEPLSAPGSAPDGSEGLPDGADRADGHAGHDHGAATASDVFDTWTWVGSSPLRRSRIEELMDALPDEIVRAKGVLSVIESPAGDDGAAGESRSMILQRVGRRWTLRPTPKPNGTGDSRCVFIGMRGSIDRRWIEQQLQDER